MLRVHTASRLAKMAKGCQTQTSNQNTILLQKFKCNNNPSLIPSSVSRFETTIHRYFSHQVLFQCPMKSRGVVGRRRNTIFFSSIRITSRRLNSSSSKGSNKTKNANNNSDITKRMIYFFKMTRIPILVLSVYQLGYQQVRLL